MAKDPAFLFYSSDYMTGTKLFSYEQKGKYVELLCLQHQTGELREKDMINICGTYDEDIFKKFTKTEDGKYYNERLKAEVDKRKAYSASRRSNRKGKKDMSIICETYDGAMSPHMENENENISISKSIGNTEAKKDFTKAPPENELLPLADCATYYFTVPAFSIAIEANCIRSGILPMDLAAWAKEFNSVQTAKGTIGMNMKEWAKYFSNWLNQQDAKNIPNNGKKKMVY